MPGKKARARAKMKRLAEKRARKQAMQAKYERWRDEGRNTKSRRARAQARKNKGMPSIKHPDGRCGNLGCQKCFGIAFRPFLRNGMPCGMPNSLWRLWSKLPQEAKNRAIEGERIFPENLDRTTM